MENTVSMKGNLAAKVIRAPGPGLMWKLRNMTRPQFIWGSLVNEAARVFSQLTRVPTITAELEAMAIRADGTVVRYGVVAKRVVTDAGVAFLVDDWDDGANDISTMNYHAAGTGAVAEAAGDTALGSEATTITDRVAGTKSQPAANQARTVATLSFTGAATITEHGLLSSITEGSGTLWDRSVFAGIGVDNGDSIQFTYTCTFNSGG